MAKLTSSMDLVQSLQTAPILANSHIQEENGLAGSSTSDLDNELDTSVLVVHKNNKVVHKGSSRHGCYADMTKRREYRREWMRAYRNAIKERITCH